MSIFVCFSSDGQGWVRWLSCLLMIGFVFLFCLLSRWGVLHRVLLVVGWCQVLYSSGFLCVSSHYLIPLSKFTFTFHFHALEKEMAVHSSVLSRRIPGTAEPAGLPSTESHRVRHDWSNLAVAAAEVSETILSSFHSFYFILLFRSYFHHFTFQLTHSLFCFRYSAIDSF